MTRLALALVICLVAAVPRFAEAVNLARAINVQVPKHDGIDPDALADRIRERMKKRAFPGAPKDGEMARYAIWVRFFDYAGHTYVVAEGGDLENMVKGTLTTAAIDQPITLEDAAMKAVEELLTKMRIAWRIGR